MIKMKQEHYAVLKILISKTNTVQTHGVIKLETVYQSEHERGAIKAKDINMRLRWDLLHCIKDEVRVRILDDLYEYLNDDHIDTALRQIMRELSAEEGANTPMETL